MIQFSLDGNKVNEFISLTEAQLQTGVELHNISECCRGNSKTAGGYIWEYDQSSGVMSSGSTVAPSIPN